MARQTEVVLLFILAIAAAASADVEKPLSEGYFDQLVQEAMKQTEVGTCLGCCPFGWVKYNGYCYSYHSSKIDWASAEKHCLKFNANLMSVHSQNDYLMAKALIRAFDPVEPPTWLGLSDCQKKNEWFWSDGTKVTFTKWNQNEPNFRNGECCVHMNWGTQRDWNDIPCDQSFPFLCAKKSN
ncbi:lactose-binding lectin l-2-like isoform X1 [Ictalurus furcatus]|uniref:lactose-binding lectin l-2-like isoform X1 n=1 Tax=Ictalurus furcatus TaxID=66913 RepID=UPI00235053B2|nr:lactose-binding lectin l-2-like isoform X1 [Ictalurus furcatus]XP_053485690.1 lactose-binding lectin l-2-like isoform X1 [Ictalurus furcatus]